MNKLRELRVARDFTQEELGKRLGVQKAAISKYEKGLVPLPQSTITKLCKIFGISADELLGIDVKPIFKQQMPVSKKLMPLSNAVGVPLVGKVHAGLPIFADENITEYIPVAASSVGAGDCFYMQVEGDCMTGDFIPEGALVLVHNQKHIRNGQIAVVRVGDEVLLRHVKYMGNHLVLISSNTKYEPIIIDDGDIEIIGYVSEVRIVL